MTTLFRMLLSTRPSRLPSATLILAAAAVLIHALPGAATRLQYDRAAIANGELWRLFSGHWTHISADHLFWNVLAFVVLGVLCERLSRRSFFVAVTSSAILIALLLWITSPGLAAYRGLSGIGSALFAFLVVTLLKSQVHARRWSSVAALSLASLLFSAKIGYEAVTGETIFVDNRSPPVLPVSLAHSVGAAVGAAVALTESRPRARTIKAADVAPDRVNSHAYQFSASGAADEIVAVPPRLSGARPRGL